MATYTRNQRRRKMLIEQRLMGAGLIVISILIFIFASTGKTFEDRDCTAIFITLPLGLLLLLSKKILIV